MLITGGASGIGEAIVRQFAAQGSRVGFLDILDGPAEALADELNQAGGTVRYAHADLTDIAALRAAIAGLRETLGPFTVLINNAAHDERHKTEDVTPEYWDGRINVNLRHQFFAAQAVLPDMKAAGGGSIVNLGSVSWMIGQGGMAAYTASKSGVIGLTRSLARDFGPDNIRVNAIAPGLVDTDLLIGKLTDEGRSRAIRNTPMGRLAQPADIANVCLYLASDLASYVTGTIVDVNGGLHIH
ncbi:MAG: SDR family oxidoreductase [Acetobacteraceae bacterium]